MKLDIGIRIRRGGFTLEADHSCTADAVGLVGPSGSGKSTLLDAISGIERGARICIDGEEIGDLPVHRRSVGYVMQDALLFPHLTVRENLLYAASAESPDDVARALEIEPLLDRMPRHLSGGERRRAALARAILAKPRLLLLDEPFGGLDARRRREAMSLLDRVRRRFRVPLILVSHLAEEVIGLTDWAVRLEAGRIAASGPSATVMRAGEHQVDNYFTGTVIGPDRVRVGTTELVADLPEGASGDVRLAVYANDIILAGDAPSSLSARNCFPTKILSVTDLRNAMLVTLDAGGLRALVTAESAKRLGVAPGASIVVILKATSIACLGAAI